jgi:DNA-binding CsgD family transcriptional regulator
VSLRGRERECALLDGLLDDVRRGEGRSLLLRGEPGIGKTALLEYLAGAAADCTVVRVLGVESEMELAYAGLHQLCAPLLERRERLPPPQREALRVVFGLSEGAAPDRFLVGLATLSLLSEAAEERPLLCVVDDGQWLDQATALTLAFVARRLLAEPIGIVFAAREPGEHLEQLAELEVQGVRNGDARALLDRAVRFKLDQRVRDQIIAETRGNPLALLELPRGLTATQLAGGFGVVGSQALTGPLEASFARRLEALSGDARRVMLVAAAESTGDPLLLWRATARLGIGPRAADDADAQGLLRIAERVSFRHPLVRSAVYGSASVEDRRAVHLALAEATDRDADPDRRAWHLAAAAAGPDEPIAIALEQSAGRAQARGGLAAAAAFLERAVALTQDSARRAERALAAAQASFQAGAFDVALRLAATAEAGSLDESQLARVDLLRANVAFASGLGRDAPALLLKAAKRLEPFDLGLARETYLSVLGAAGMAGNIAAGGIATALRDAVDELPPTPGGPHALDLLLDCLARVVTDGPAVAAPSLRRATEALTDLPVDDVLRWGWMAPAAFGVAWDLEGMHALVVRMVQLVRDAGALARLPFYLGQLGLTLPWLGDFAGADALVAEEEAAAAATGSPIAPYTLMRLRALQGKEPEALALIATAMEKTAVAGQGFAAAWARWSTAILYNALGRYEEAAAAARQIVAEDVAPWTEAWTLPELIEGASRAGDAGLASEALARLTMTTRARGTDVGLGVEARSRALLSEGDTADALYREAVERLSRTLLRPELARAQLLYGEWLRSEGRRADARAQLSPAHAQFTSIGMEAFAERARKELAATGERVRRRGVEARDELTSHERQIAQLASEGLSNPEIGARLFLSPRTVEWHLHKVFAKLGVRSRGELASALSGPVA